MFTTSISKLSAENADKLLMKFYEAIHLASVMKINTSIMIMSFGRLGKHLTELDSDKENNDIVSFSLTIGEIAELHRKNNFEESINRLEELIGEVTDSDSITDNIKIMRHYLTLVQADKEKAADMKEHSEAPKMSELANQIKQLIRGMIDNWDLDGAEDALNRMAEMAPFDPDIENIRDEIMDRKINYMKYM